MTKQADTTKGRTLSTAEERREAVLEAAMDLFAERGFLGTPTAPIAKAAGISQAYLFRLFPTKEDLVQAVVARANDEIVRTFSRTAAEAAAKGDLVLDALGRRYSEMVADRRTLQLQMHQHAAAVSDPAIAAACRDTFRRLVELLQDKTDYDDATLQSFFAMGMLVNVMTATGIVGSEEPFAQVIGHDTGLCGPAA